MNEETIAGIVGHGRTMGALPDYGGAYLEPGVLEACTRASCTSASWTAP